MTIFGAHTIHELQDLLASYDFQVAQLEKAAANSLGPWTMTDPVAEAQWFSDFATASSHYRSEASSIRQVIQMAIDGHSDPDITLAYPEWDRARAAFDPILGLYRRLSVAGVNPDGTGNPQPTAPDHDLGAFQWADKAIRTVTLGGTLPWWVLPVALPAGIALVTVRAILK